jgi:outer membrane beta-barrel protein
MWAPVYGKISLASEWVMHFDTYLAGGVGVVGSQQSDQESSMGLAASFGLGMHFFVSRSVALKLELKDFLVFNDKVSIASIDESDVQHQLVFNLGLSFFFLDGASEN